jgi:hypothetical protein
MRRKGITMTLQERLEIGEKSADGHTDPEIAIMTSIELPTYQKIKMKGRTSQRDKITIVFT